MKKVSADRKWHNIKKAREGVLEKTKQKTKRLKHLQHLTALQEEKYYASDYNKIVMERRQKFVDDYQTIFDLDISKLVIV